ncbi:MAG TPA: serine acetyltransferase [Bacteroidales bacterium]|nr:serine acetyltransferase [Bacteroidales bacterium]
MKKRKNSKLVELFSSPQYILPVNKTELEKQVPLIFSLLFPDSTTDISVEGIEARLESIYQVIKENIAKLLSHEEATSKLDTLIKKIPRIKENLLLDAQAFVDNDPAAKSIEEVIFTYPGFFALTVHRIAHELYRLNVPIIPRLLSEYAHKQTGIDIHPGAKIGNSLFLDHGTGIVIGETCVIGNNVKIYQNVTLGALHVVKNNPAIQRHPTVEDNVIIYAGATILGGKTIIGNNSIIGGNVWLTQSVLPHSLVYYSSEMKFRHINERTKRI